MSERIEVYVPVTPFVPAPLVDAARGKGFAAEPHRERHLN